MVIGKIKKIIKSLPAGPGVYVFKDKKAKTLYVGKAVSLKKRVVSHFNKASQKRDIFIREVADIEYIGCSSPQQALVLEAALIKESKPKYNIALRDDKSYPYIEITKEKFPRIFISRPKKKPKSLIFGPYPQAKELKSALVMIRKILPYCSCKSRPKKVCLYYHIGLCPGPCSGKLPLMSYQENIRSIVKILKGERRKLIKELKSKMQRLSQAKKFEAASILRDKITAINSLYEGKSKPHELISLKESLGLMRLPLVIEAIDISSLGNDDSVGSVVVFRDGFPDKSSYRRFKIRATPKRDDYAKIEEVVTRRYSRLLKEGSLPDLVIIDGGQGHVMTAYRKLLSLGLKVPVIGIAKKKEEIWKPLAGRPLRISKENPGLQLIQRARDEAHRFAHTYGLLRRRKRVFSKS